MSDSLLPWMNKYIQLVQSGTKPVEALKACMVTLETFSMARLQNTAFKAALELVDAGVHSTALDPVQLLKLREAGVDDVRAAAWFGMTVDEFGAAISGDKDLRRIYETGVKRGEAMLQVAQFENAITGDTQMQKHLGEFRLDQISKKDQLLTARELDEVIRMAEAQLAQKQVTKAMVIIEAEAREVADE